jgi:hypothetical protein
MRLPLLCAALLSLLAALTLPFASASATTSVMPTAPDAPVVSVPSADAPLAGTYDCQGVEPDGTPYHGIVQITPNQGTYDVVWIFSSGQEYAGLGVVNGDVLAVSYFTNRPGVVAYKIQTGEKGPRLQGQWTVVGAGKVFQETLTQVSRDVKRPEPPPQPQRREAAPLLRHLRPA